jgi:hypothetical protein
MPVYHMFTFVLYFIHLFNIFIMGSVVYRVYALLTKQRPIAILPTSSIRQYYFSFYKFPKGFNSLANSFCIAMRHLVWLFSRKYGTVWYHPASSKLWYLTILSFVNFQEKLTGMSSSLFARAKPACSACCVFGARCTFCVNRNVLQEQVEMAHTFV